MPPCKARFFRPGHTHGCDRPFLRDVDEMILKPITALTRFLDKVGGLATLTATMACASCFPALASLASSMGFLAQYEGIFVNTLLPFFAAVVMLMNAIAFIGHRVWYRGLAGIAGPNDGVTYPVSSLVLWLEYLFTLLRNRFNANGVVMGYFSPPHKISLFYYTTSPKDYNAFLSHE